MKELVVEMKKNFTYNPDTGELKRLTRKNSNGSFDKDGYLIIKYKGKQIKAHRLAWLLFYGVLPEKELDHINRNRTDNRIINLRQADRILNNKNNSKKGYYLENTKGLKKKYCVKYNKKTYRFYTENEAYNFRLEVDIKNNIKRRTVWKY